MRIPSLLLAVALAASVLKGRNHVLLVPADAATTTSSTGSTTSGAADRNKPSHRRNNLDYLNADALEYFLSYPPLEYDAVILFYANWDRHSHSFATIYAQIATLLLAGSVESNLILGLFDCEADTRHMHLCTKAEITHYPTTLYFSFSNRKRYKFGGNWGYGDSVLDWIKTLRALSYWHRSGWGKRLRMWVFGGRGNAKKNTPKPELPVGMPTTDAAASSSASSPVAAAAALQELDKLRQESRAGDDLLVRSAAMLEAALFPMRVAGPARSQMHDAYNRTFTDLFAFLNQTEGWSSTAPKSKVLRSCLQDLSLEYCQRYTTIMTEEFLAEYPGVVADKSNQDLVSRLSDRLEEQEPYCMLVDACVINGFVHAKCRPSGCPFSDPTACRFLTSCFYESMQKQYAKALGVELPPANATVATSPTGDARTDQGNAQHASKGKKKSGWGVGG